jgi:hypothetical protein
MPDERTPPMILEANGHYWSRGSWNFLHGNPVRYLHAMQETVNRSSVYSPERLPKPRSKHEFARLVSAEGGRAPHAVALIRNGEVTGPLAADGKTLEEFLHGLPAGHYFCKPDEGSQGAGAMHIEVAAGDVKVDDEAKPQGFLERALSRGTFVIQEWLVPRQHPLMARFNPAVINTIRLVTFDTQEGPMIVAGLFRSAVESVSVDNWSAGGVATFVDSVNGVLCADGIMKGRTGILAAHPGSGIVFGGQAIPYFHEAAALVKKLHGRLRAKTLGWDLALLENGPLVLECNSHWDILVTGYYDAAFAGKFLDFHLLPHQQSLRLRFRGNLRNRGAFGNFLCQLLGGARLSGRIDRLSPTEAIVTAAGAREALRVMATRLKASRFRQRFDGITAERVPDELPPGLDIALLFYGRGDNTESLARAD